MKITLRMWKQPPPWLFLFFGHMRVCFINVVFFSVGDNSRGGSPGAQRFQEKTRLRAGDIGGFTGGKLKVCVWACTAPLTDSSLLCVVFGAWWSPCLWCVWLDLLFRPQETFNCDFRCDWDLQLRLVFTRLLPSAHLSILLGFLQVCLKYYEYEFMELACQCPAVVCCRCTPTQKAQIVRLLQERTGKLTCAVGGSSSYFYAFLSVINASSFASVRISTCCVCRFVYTFLPAGLAWKRFNMLVWFPLSKHASAKSEMLTALTNNEITTQGEDILAHLLDSVQFTDVGFYCCCMLFVRLECQPLLSCLFIWQIPNWPFSFLAEMPMCYQTKFRARLLKH